MLKKLYIHNFKSFWHSSFEFGKVNCLIAPNNTGKSNLLEAIEFCDDLLFNPNGEQKTFKTNQHHPDEKNTVFNIEFEFSNRVLVYKELIDYVCTITFMIHLGEINTIDVTVNGKVKHINILEEDKVVGWFNYFRLRSYGDGLNHSLKDYSKYDALISNKRYSAFHFKYNQNSLTYTLDCQKNEKNALMSLFGLNLNSANELMKPIDFKHIFSRYSIFQSHYFHAHMMKYTQITPKTTELLNKDGTNLVSYLSSLDKETLEDISTSLIGEVERVNGIEITQDAHKRLWFVEDALKIPLEETSDGTVHFVAIMSALLGNKHSIASMIEEPERHMHMKVLSYILNTMRDDNKQIFFTTHSGELLKILNQDEIVFLYRDEENGDTKGLSASKIKSLKKVFETNKYDISEIITNNILGYIGDYDA